MKKTTQKRILAAFLTALTIFMSACSSVEEPPLITDEETETDMQEEFNEHEEVAILFTGNILGKAKKEQDFTVLKNRADELKKSGIAVDIVDCGNHVSSEGSGNAENAVKTLKAMSSAGYSHVLINDHEFDFGIEGLRMMLKNDGPVNMSCNFRYSGFGDDITSDVMREDVVEFGSLKVGYVAVSDTAIIDTHAGDFIEDARTAYSFCGRSVSHLADTIQESVNICRDKGADYVIVISGLVYNEKMNLDYLVPLLYDVDAVICPQIDGGDSVRINMGNGNDEEIPVAFVKNGADRFGELRISPSGSISFTFR
ncbi:MAG: hypothetical protein K6F44_01150 [Lachnospiraceae bacterium]|nr:hypothetical protein [Lachnospiraceae bacterium]